MRTITEEGIALIKKFEGFSATPYLDIAGIWTIGYGHIKGVTKDTPAVSPKEAEDLLASDIQNAQRSVLRLITVPLSDGQYDALVSFTYNMGGGKLQSSTLRRKINRQQYAADEFLRWVYAGGIKSAGLIRRRRAERALYLSV